MAISTPPPLPGRRRAGFSDAVDAFVTWFLTTFPDEFNSTVAALNLNSTTGVSSTSNAVGTGAKTFTADLDKSWQPGMWVMVADAAAPSTNWMAGPVTSYNASTGALVVNMTVTGGTGTKTSWKISQSAPGGAGLSANKFTGVQQYDQGANIASGATVDLGAATGNSVTITHSTGTTAITSFGGATAMQSGSIMDLEFAITGGALSLTHNGTSLVIPGGANLTLSNGDNVRLRKTSDASANWEVIGFLRGDGTPLALPNASTSIKGALLLASAAEAQGFSEATKALTAATLSSAFQGGNQSIASTGFQKFPGGLILQWGLATIDQNQAIVVTLPTAWPTGLLGGTVSRNVSYISGLTDTAMLLRANPTNPLTQINIESGANSGSSSHSSPAFFMALGR